MSALAPRLLDRYIFKQLFDYFLLGVVVFTLIFFFSDTLLTFIQEIQSYGLSAAMLMTLVGLQLPKSVAWVLPASGFLAVLMVFNNLNNQFEIISMRMNGISLWRLILAPLVLGVFCSAATYLLNDYVVPWCNARTEDMTRQLMKSGTLPATGNSFMHPIFNERHNLERLIYVSHYEGRTLGDTTIIDLAQPRVMQIFQARGGTWEQSGGLTLRNVNTYVVASNSQNSFASHMDVFNANNLFEDSKEAEVDYDIENRKRQGIHVDPERQSFAEMSRAIQRRIEKKRPVPRSNYLDLWEKLTWPLGALALILNAVPLALSPPRQAANRGFLFAIVILSLYYMLFTSFQQIGRVRFFDFLSLGLPQPFYLAALSWVPLLIILAIGFWMIRKKTYQL